MYNFILIIRRFFNLLLFIGLEIVCIVLIARTKNMMQGNDILSSANAVTGFVYTKQNNMVQYFGLSRMNESLLQENLELKTQLAAYRAKDTLTDKNISRPLLPEPGDTSHVIQYAKYRYYQARVISNSVSATDNYITLNRGSSTGIQKNMAVVSSSGLVGKVINVSAHYATAISILNTKQPISARLKSGYGEVITWDKAAKPDELHMKNIPQEIKVKIGDSVFTTSYSKYFPRDILVGTVSKIKRFKKDGSQMLYIKPATNFRTLQYVYIIGDEYLPERVQLEAQSNY